MITKIIKKKITSKLTHGITGEQQATNKQLTTNNNDNKYNNINLFILNKEESDFVPFSEGDEISEWLKTKGINSVKEYKELDSFKQDELMEEWFSK